MFLPKSATPVSEVSSVGEKTCGSSTLSKWPKDVIGAFSGTRVSGDMRLHALTYVTAGVVSCYLR